MLRPVPMKRFYIAVYMDALPRLAEILHSTGNVALAEPIAKAKQPTEVSPSLQEIDQMERRLSELRRAAEVAQYLKLLDLKATDIGDFTYAFTRVGIVQQKAYKKLKLEEKLKSLSAATEVRKLDKKRLLMVVVAPNERKAEVMELLRRANFEELSVPGWMDSDPSIALEKIRKEYDELSKRLIKTKLFAKVVQSSTGVANFAVITGWTPLFAVDDLRRAVSELGDRLVYFGTEDPLPGDEVPVKLGYKGLLGRLSLITEMRGLPHYFEIDPTPIFTALYVTMFGMMFGDVGGAIVLLLLGAFLSKKAGGLGKFGGLLLACGTSALVFGFLYGSFFLNEEVLLPFYESIHFKPYPPLHNMNLIMAIALVFGAIQMLVAMVLSTANRFLWGETFDALFTRWGIPSIMYYIAGITLALKFIQGGMNVSSLVAPDSLPLVAICLMMLGVITVSPAIKHYRHTKKLSFDALMEGVGEVLEVLIAYLCNSVSYVRLAAFAIAHGALAAAIPTVAAFAGEVGAYLMMNAIAIVIEGFAAGIQALRLLFYEFSTKFYRGGGKPFEPIRV